MRCLAPLVLLLSTVGTPAAQPADPGDAPSFTMDGTLGLGQLFSSRIERDGRLHTLFGLDAAVDAQYQRHALGVRMRVFTPLSGSNMLWELGTVYTLNVANGLWMGAGVAYVAETYDGEGTTRVGVPVEVMLRFPTPEQLRPYIRAFANVNVDHVFGGLSVGVTL
jgi:hypothetical protein